MYKNVFLDTGFIIRLLDENHKQHGDALSYYRYFKDKQVVMRLSSIAVAEYCVKGEFEDLPISSILLSPFNPMHAVKAGECARVLYKERSKWIKSVGGRDIMKNDVKLMAHAAAEKAECYVTFDADSRKLYQILKEASIASFEFWDANNPVSVYNGEIPFE